MMSRGLKFNNKIMHPHRNKESIKGDDYVKNGSQEARKWIEEMLRRTVIF
jgi:hypothetical protein